MYIGILKKGDKVLSITQDFVAIERKNGEVDVYPIVKDGDLVRIDTQGIVTIGFGDNLVATQVGDVTVTTF